MKRKVQNTSDERVWGVVKAIQAAIDKRHGMRPLDASMGLGLGGPILLNRYMYQIDPVHKYERTAELYLEEMLEKQQFLSPLSFGTGVLGVAWLLAHLARLDKESAALDEMDGLLAAMLKHPWDWKFDLTDGLVGVGLYALERRDGDVGEGLLEQFVLRLAEMALEKGSRVSWFTRPEFLVARSRARYPNGCWDLGMAHGLAGCIAVLGLAVESGLSENVGSVAKNLIRKSGDYLVSMIYEHQGRLCVPARDQNTIKPNSRLAWCYNELGVACALQIAGRAIGHRSFEVKARDIARSTIGMTIEDSGCVDAGLCHGTSGVAHLYHVLGQASADPEIVREGKRWLNITLELHDPEVRCGGYWSIRKDPKLMTTEKIEAYGLYNGVSGIGLSLLSTAFGTAFNWDRALGLS